MVSRIATVTVLVAMIAVGGTACGSLSGSAGAPTTGRLTLKPCTMQEIPARCGTFVVPENRLKPNGRTIGLRVVVLPALLKPVASDAVTYITGGPGYAVTDDTSVLANELIDLNEHRDILLVDQRGTGSDAYYCPNPNNPLNSNGEERNYIRDCLKAFGGDINQYGTRTAMDDLDAVRAALGYRQLDVIGGSYGATAAQVYLNLHPSSVRTLILESGTAIDVPLFGRWAVNAQHALDLVAAICHSQPGCRQAFPNWERQFGELVKAWNAHPVQIRRGVMMTGDELAGVVHVMLLDMNTAASIPLVVSSAAKGDFAPLNQQAPGDLRPPGPQLMPWSIWCNEPWTGLDANPPWGTEFDSYTAAYIAEFRRGCTFFPKRAEPASLWTFPSSSTVPVLAVVGGADPQDPATNLPDLKQHFPDSRIVILPHIGHELDIGISGTGCIDTMMLNVVERATTKGLNTSLCNGAIVFPPIPLTG